MLIFLLESFRSFNRDDFQFVKCQRLQLYCVLFHYSIEPDVLHFQRNIKQIILLLTMIKMEIILKK